AVTIPSNSYCLTAKSTGITKVLQSISAQPSRKSSNAGRSPSVQKYTHRRLSPSSFFTLASRGSVRVAANEQQKNGRQTWRPSFPTFLTLELPSHCPRNSAQSSSKTITSCTAFQ